MKHIVKEQSPKDFEDWKATGNEDWKPEYSNMRGDIKYLLHSTLLREQKYVCCYCGGVVSIEDSHIEHFNPQNMAPNLALDYANLHASCIRERKPTTPIHCGHKKGGDFDSALVISPLSDDCESRYGYSLNGEINVLQQDDARATYMVNLLDLSNAALRNRREGVLKSVFDDDFIGTATIEDLKTLVASFRTAVDGRLSDLGHVVARFAERLGGVEPATH